MTKFAVGEDMLKAYLLKVLIMIYLLTVLYCRPQGNFLLLNKQQWLRSAQIQC